MSGKPHPTTPPNNSSTNESSDRRRVPRSSWAWARKARGYTLPLCGELKTIGPRQCCGSRISNGGSSSSWAAVMMNVEDQGCVNAPARHSTLLGLRHDIVHTKRLRRQAHAIHPVFTALLAYGARTG